MLSHFSHVRLCVTPWTAAHQAPPSTGFSRQEYWSGVPLPSPIDSLVDASLRLGSRLCLWFKPWVWMGSPGRMWSRRPKSKTWTILMHKGHVDEDEPAKNCQKEHPATSEGNQENPEIQKPRQDYVLGEGSSQQSQCSEKSGETKARGWRWVCWSSGHGRMAVHHSDLPAERTWPKECSFFLFFLFLAAPHVVS